MDKINIAFTKNLQQSNGGSKLLFLVSIDKIKTH